MSNRLALCNTVLPGPRPVDLSTGFSILPGRPEAIEKSIRSAAFLSACEGHNTRSQAVGSGPFINRYSVEFDGVNDLMSIDFGRTPNSYSAYSFGGWVKFQSFTSGGGPLQLTHGSGWTSNTFIRVDSATSILIYHTDDSTYRYAAANYTLTLGKWHHFVQVWDGSDVKLYIDGALRGTLANVTSWGDIGNNVKLLAGFARQGYHNGLIDEVSWFSSALSASDITSIYNEGTPNDISSLEPVGWWRMGDSNSGVGTTVTDVGSGGNDGTLENGAEFIDKTVLRKPEDATVVYNYPETSDIPIKPIDLSVSLSDEGAGLIDPTDLQVLLYPPNLRISIQDTEENILARTGDTAGTMAFGTDTNNLYIANTEGFDSWSSIEDN